MKNIIALLFILVSFAVVAAPTLNPMFGTSGTAIAATSPVVNNPNKTWMSFQGSVSGVGAVSSVQQIQYSNDNVNWNTAGTITLTGTNNVSDMFASSTPYFYIRAVQVSIGGTSAVANVYMAQ